MSRRWTALWAAVLPGCSILLDDPPCGVDTGTTVDSGVVESVLWQAVSAGGLHSCGVDATGAAQCWGLDEEGQATPPAGLSSGVLQVAAGHAHSCAAPDAAAPVCWGRDTDGQVSAAPGDVLVAIDGGGAHSCGRTDGGAVRCWGRDLEGQSTVPDDIFDGVTPAVDVVAGWRTSCAVDGLGALVCWGDDRDGLVSTAPTAPVQRVDLGRDFGLAVAETGDLLCWGTAAMCASVPVVTTGVGVAAGRDWGCVTDTDGALSCFGTRDVDDPVLADVPVLDSPTELVGASGGLHACALHKSGEGDGTTATCWGLDDAGQLSVLD